MRGRLVLPCLPPDTDWQPADIGDKIYVIGGGPEPDISFANVVEILNVGSNSVTTGAPTSP